MVVLLAEVVVHVSATVNQSVADLHNSLCGINALEQAVAHVKADGEHGIVQRIVQLVEALGGGGDGNTADILNGDLDAELASVGDEASVEIKIEPEQDLGVVALVIL